MTRVAQNGAVWSMVPPSNYILRVRGKAEDHLTYAAILPWRSRVIMILLQVSAYLYRSPFPRDLSPHLTYGFAHRVAQISPSFFLSGTLYSLLYLLLGPRITPRCASTICAL